MIRVTCTTNLDDYNRENWPTEMVEIPLIGHFVESDNGKRLKVVGIVHRAETFGYKAGVVVELGRVYEF